VWGLFDPERISDTDHLPSPRAEYGALIDPLDWIAAQGRQATALARAAMAVGQLDMVVAQVAQERAQRQGILERLALREVEAMTWAAGTPLSAEEIGRAQLRTCKGYNRRGGLCGA